MFGSRPDRRTHGARAVVTGAGSGIGRAFALELARRGGSVICADIDVDRAQETATLIQGLGSGSARAVFCDVSRTDDIDALADLADGIRLDIRTTVRPCCSRKPVCRNARATQPAVPTSTARSTSQVSWS